LRNDEFLFSNFVILPKMLFFLVVDRTLATVLDIQVGGSRMEVVASKDGAPFLTLNATQNRADLACMIASLPIRKCLF